MLHHLSLAVADLDRAAAFYDAVLEPLGYVRVWSFPTAVGYGPPGGGDRLALKLRPDRPTPPPSGFHLALAAPDADAVRAFHERALELGGEDLGAPGLRPEFGEGYFAAFVRDLDGWWLEAVVRS
ncbi:MAG: VOC family protein [Alphaproteobacteria bacterium]|nr:VOC family protein [Alphaproteobacteria bacterium]